MVTAALSMSALIPFHEGCLICGAELAVLDCPERAATEYLAEPRSSDARALAVHTVSTAMSKGEAS